MRIQRTSQIVTVVSDPFFLDEVPRANVRSGPYPSLLNEIAKPWQ